MALRDTWSDKANGVDDILAEDINAIAHAVMANETDLEGVEDSLDVIIQIQDNLIGGGEAE